VKFSAVIFDLGGVLIRLDYQRTIAAFKQLGISNFEELYTQANQQQLFDLFETGMISPQRFINELLDFLPNGTSPNQVVNAWNTMILDVPSASINVLNQVRKTHHIVLLSNTNALHVPVVRKEWRKLTDRPMEDFFDGLYFSHELGLRKPHPDTFRTVCQREDILPEETLFIDDSFQHIEGARIAGLQTHHLQSIEELTHLFS